MAKINMDLIPLTLKCVKRGATYEKNDTIT